MNSGETVKSFEEATDGHWFACLFDFKAVWIIAQNLPWGRTKKMSRMLNIEMKRDMCNRVQDNEILLMDVQYINLEKDKSNQQSKGEHFGSEYDVI